VEGFLPATPPLSLPWSPVIVMLSTRELLPLSPVAEHRSVMEIAANEEFKSRALPSVRAQYD